MAYYLTIQKGKNEYKEINISSLNEFKRLSKFKDSYSLEEIDMFTSMFADEVNLKEILYDNGLICLEDISKEISIRQKSKNELKKVRYGLVYKDTKKYLDYDYLKNIILSMQNDKTFLKKLVSNYRNSYSCVIEISEIKNYLFYSNSEVDIYLTLNNFFLNEILKKDLKTGEFKIKYKSLHDLAMFVRNYMEKMSLGVTENFENINLKKRLLLLEKSKLTNGVDAKLTPKTKKLTRKKLSKQPLEGQISLFD